MQKLAITDIKSVEEVESAKGISKTLTAAGPRGTCRAN
jgi:hypothetical protein